MVGIMVNYCKDPFNSVYNTNILIGENDYNYVYIGSYICCSPSH